MVFFFYWLCQCQQCISQQDTVSIYNVKKQIKISSFTCMTVVLHNLRNKIHINQKYFYLYDFNNIENRDKAILVSFWEKQDIINFQVNWRNELSGK